MDQNIYLFISRVGTFFQALHLDWMKLNVNIIIQHVRQRGYIIWTAMWRRVFGRNTNITDRNRKFDLGIFFNVKKLCWELSSI